MRDSSESVQILFCLVWGLAIGVLGTAAGISLGWLLLMALAGSMFISYLGYKYRERKDG